MAGATRSCAGFSGAAFLTETWAAPISTRPPCCARTFCRAGAPPTLAPSRRSSNADWPNLSETAPASPISHPLFPAEHRGAYITGSEAVFRDDRAGWISASKTSASSGELFSSSQLEAGELAKRNYRAFVLPYSVALSDQEAAALRSTWRQAACSSPTPKSASWTSTARTRLKPCSKISSASLGTRWTLRFRPRGGGPFRARQRTVQVERPEGGRQRGGAGAENPGRRGARPPWESPSRRRSEGRQGVAVFANFFMDSYPQRRGLNIEAPLRNVL